MNLDLQNFPEFSKQDEQYFLLFYQTYRSHTQFNVY